METGTTTPTPIPEDPTEQMALVLSTMEAIVDEYGHEYVYPLAVIGDACYYLDPITRQPSCLIGHVLVRLGTPVELIAQVESMSPDGEYQDSWAEEMTFGRFDLSVRKVMRSAQSRQDHGRTWGDALRAAKEYAAWLVTQGNKS